MMKRIFLFALLLSSFSLSAKKVMFRVNMQGQSVMPTGIHVTGDFQDEAGFAADWDPGTTVMAQDASNTDIYWCVVDIPAFVHYEFKYVNGDQGYEQEFVPLESRVNYNFLDNRWVYVDSLANDTLMMPAVRFAGNAPAGKSLIRFYVDMTNESSVSTNGVHLVSDMNSFSTTAAHLFSFDGVTYEYIDYVDSGLTAAHQYKFANGNTGGDIEALAGWCQDANGYRSIAAPRDTMLPVVCYTFCAACNTVGITEGYLASFGVQPNPAVDFFRVSFATAETRTVSVVDSRGRQIYSMQTSDPALWVDVTGYSSGVYFIRVMTGNGSVQMKKFVVE